MEAEPQVPRTADRVSFLWNQHNYVSDYIKFADAKAALIASGTIAIIGTSYGSSLSTEALALKPPQGVHGYLSALGFGLLAASVLLSAWCIKPRLLTGKRIRPMSWVDIENYPDADAFERAHSRLGSAELAALLGQQIYYMSKICKRKHLLVGVSLFLCVAGSAVTALRAFRI